MRGERTTLADHGGGAPEPEIPAAADLDALDARLRDEASELLAAEPDLFR